MRDSIQVAVGYLGLDALPWNSHVHVYVEDLSIDSPGESQFVAEQTVVTKGEQIPILISVSIPHSRLRKKHLYSICADISIPEKPAFTCDKPFQFRGSKLPNHVTLTLRRFL